MKTPPERQNSETEAILSKYNGRNKCYFVKAQWLMFSIKICHVILSKIGYTSLTLSQEQGIILKLFLVRDRVKL